jgi:hypothetical protein
VPGLTDGKCGNWGAFRGSLSGSVPGRTAFLPDNSGRNNRDGGGGTVAGRVFIHQDAKEQPGQAYRIAPPRDVAAIVAHSPVGSRSW